jgi:hypothetical protein
MSPRPSAVPIRQMADDVLRGPSQHFDALLCAQRPTTDCPAELLRARPLQLLYSEAANAT